MKFRIAEGLEIDYEDYKDEGLRIAILARSGGGKSNLSALFAESALDQGMQVCVIEPIEEWWTLRSLYDSVVWVGDPEDGADLPLNPDQPGAYTEVLAKGGSLVLTAGVIGDEYGEKDFVARFLWSLYTRWKKVRRPILLIVEETDMYAPQSWTKEDRPSLSKIALLAKRGRKLGINCIFISQRPADIHKSVISQANIIFLGGFKTTQDLQAVKTLSRLLHLPIPTQEVSKFEPGEFFVCVKGEVKRIKAYFRKTPHGGETPKLGKPVKPELRSLVSDIKQALMEAWRKKQEESNLIKRLQKENEELRRTIKELEEKIKVLKTVKEIPLEVKAVLDEIRIPAQPSQGFIVDSIPMAVKQSPYPHTIEFYQVLSSSKGWIKLSDAASKAGISRDRAKKIAKYLYRKGILSVKWGHQRGKKYPVAVKLRGLSRE